jgi:hypothetical protein
MATLTAIGYPVRKLNLANARLVLFATIFVVVGLSSLAIDMSRSQLADRYAVRFWPGHIATPRTKTLLSIKALNSPSMPTARSQHYPTGCAKVQQIEASPVLDFGMSLLARPESTQIDRKPPLSSTHDKSIYLGALGRSLVRR